MSTWVLVGYGVCLVFGLLVGSTLWNRFFLQRLRAGQVTCGQGADGSLWCQLDVELLPETPLDGSRVEVKWTLPNPAVLRAIIEEADIAAEEPPEEERPVFACACDWGQCTARSDEVDVEDVKRPDHWAYVFAERHHRHGTDVLHAHLCPEHSRALFGALAGRKRPDAETPGVATGHG